MGDTDCPMDGDAFPHPCPRLHRQVNHIPVQYSHASPGSARQNGRQDRQGTTPSELWPSASTRKQLPTFRLSWPSTTFGGQNFSTASTMADQAFGLGTRRRCKRFSTRQEKARMRNPCTKQGPNPSLRSNRVIEPNLSLGGHSPQHRPAQRDANLLADHLRDLFVLWCLPLLPDLKTCRQS